MSQLMLLSPSVVDVQRAISMPGVGEWLVILVIVLVVFGPGKLPMIGDALGKSIKNFKRASSRDEEIDVTPRDQIADSTRPTGATRVSASEEQHSTSRS